MKTTIYINFETKNILNEKEYLNTIKENQNKLKCHKVFNQFIKEKLNGKIYKEKHLTYKFNLYTYNLAKEKIDNDYEKFEIDF